MVNTYQEIFYRQIQKKTSLKIQYDYMYHLLIGEIEHIKSKKILEVGSGTNISKKYIPHLLTSDVEPGEVDYHFDAHKMPFAKNSFDCIMGIDFIHHLDHPLVFLKECHRVLTDGGKLLFIEPWITPFSFPIYKFFHHERCDFDLNIAQGSLKKSTDPWEGNQTIPFLLFSKGFRYTSHTNLFLQKLRLFSGLSFPLSGGIRHREFIHFSWWKKFFAWEQKFPQALLQLLAFRALIVLKKRKTS